MKRKKNLVQMQKDISKKLLESMRLLEIIDILNEGEEQTATLVAILSLKIKSAFYKISKCQNITSTAD